MPIVLQKRKQMFKYLWFPHDLTLFDLCTCTFEHIYAIILQHIQCIFVRCNDSIRYEQKRCNFAQKRKQWKNWGPLLHFFSWSPEALSLCHRKQTLGRISMTLTPNVFLRQPTCTLWLHHFREIWHWFQKCMFLMLRHMFGSTSFKIAPSGYHRTPLVIGHPWFKNGSVLLCSKSLSWLRSLSPYGITRSQWVKCIAWWLMWWFLENTNLT